MGMGMGGLMKVTLACGTGGVRGSAVVRGAVAGRERSSRAAARVGGRSEDMIRVLLLLLLLLLQ